MWPTEGITVIICPRGSVGNFLGNKGNLTNQLQTTTQNDETENAAKGKPERKVIILLHILQEMSYTLINSVLFPNLAQT
jgi:hypothetical protein